MQDNDERLGTRHPIKPAVMGFPADKMTCRMQTFESISLRPLRYVCLFGFLSHRLAQRLEKCEISMQDNDERLGTRHPIKPAVMGFPADKVTCWMQTFECSLLRPLEYICIFNFVARNFPQGVISSQSRYDRFDTSAYLVLLHATWAIWFAPYYILHTAT